MGDAYAIAFKLLTLGFSVIPSGAGDKGKAPLVKWRELQDTTPSEGQLETWEDQLKPHIWGIVTNDRIAVIDADTPETRAQLETELGEPHVTTPRGGAHWYIDTTGHPLKTIAGLLPGIDVRGVGGFVNIAGGKYEIRRLPVPGDTLIPWDKLPKNILEALNGNRPTRKAQQGTPIPDTTRNATLTSLAGTMRRRGMTQEAIEAALLATPCDPPLPEDEIRKIATSVSRYEPAKTPAQTREDIINLIRAFTGQANTISIPRALLDFFGGDYPTAILCNQLLYWQDKQRREDGGIYKTYKDWRSEIGLSEYQIRRAANKLKRRGFLETRLHKADGSPTVHYYFNVVMFSESILEFLQNPNLSFSRIHGEETKESLTDNTS